MSFMAKRGDESSGRRCESVHFLSFVRQRSISFTPTRPPETWRCGTAAGACWSFHPPAARQWCTCFQGCQMVRTVRAALGPPSGHGEAGGGRAGWPLVPLWDQGRGGWERNRGRLPRPPIHASLPARADGSPPGDSTCHLRADSFPTTEPDRGASRPGSCLLLPSPKGDRRTSGLSIPGHVGEAP